MIIQSDIAAQGVRQALGWTEAGGSQHLADAAIEALDHAVGLGMTGLDEAVVDAMLLAGAVEAMKSGGIISTSCVPPVGLTVPLLSKGAATPLAKHNG